MESNHLQSLHFSSKEDSWETPEAFFNKYNDLYKFTLDVCAEPHNTKVDNFYTKEVDGLSQDWAANNVSAWMNPPYGREIGDWMKKAYEESLKGCTVVCLVPSRTDTRWWHDWAIKGDVEFIKGRLKFNGHKHNAPFPSAIVVFKGINK